MQEKKIVVETHLTHAHYRKQSYFKKGPIVPDCFDEKKYESK